MRQSSTTPRQSERSLARGSPAPVFKVDVEQSTWDVREGDATIEFVIDRGEVVVAGDRRLPICEVELELKHGRDLAEADDEARHMVRKDAKKLRYASEFFRRRATSSPGSASAMNRALTLCFFRATREIFWPPRKLPMTRWSTRSDPGAEPNGPPSRRVTSARLDWADESDSADASVHAFPTLDWNVQHDAVVHSGRVRSVTPRLPLSELGIAIASMRAAIFVEPGRIVLADKPIPDSSQHSTACSAFWRGAEAVRGMASAFIHLVCYGLFNPAVLSGR
ncbi:CHAD domain-containing protein [Sphingomonas sp.]|uniref:CHAD domain-containing protein n=1 Tax=Sphingomonas sp. TaxID=28214 RepID=UPI0037526C09